VSVCGSANGFVNAHHGDRFIAPGDKRKTTPGMLLSIEPGVYFKGKGDYRHSDTAPITEAGNSRGKIWKP